MAVLEVLAGVKEVVVTVAAAVGAGVAVFGLRSWERELIGRADFETARAVALATYRVRDAMDAFRSPFYTAGEFPRGSVEDGQEAWAHVYGNRWKGVAAAMTEFDAKLLEGEALWGAPIRDAASGLRECASALLAATQAVIDDKRDNGETFRADRDFAKAMRGTVSSSGGDDNTFTRRSRVAVETLQEFLKPHLRRR